MARAADLLLKDIDDLLAAIKRRAFEHKMTPTIGRSHGIHAEPVTFGLKLATAYAEFTRCRERLVAARKDIATCAISGAVGTFANIDPLVEEHVAKAMGLSVEPVSTQVIPRDRHAAYFAALGVVASSLERLAVEIRHLQRTEVLEAEEPFTRGQKGSSAMPHKRNPITWERLTGLARVIRGNAVAALENVALWHERDISHSSVERVIFPDSCTLLDYMFGLLTRLMDGLLVYPENMRKNLGLSLGMWNSQTVLLAGVNDDAQTLGQLMRAFVETRIKPYYLHHPDLAPGTSHLRVSISRGQALVRALLGRVSGLCQPAYVLDIPGGFGKVPLESDHLEISEAGIRVRDLEDRWHAYADYICS
jgi:adenylosuccinate lyase